MSSGGPAATIIDVSTLFPPGTDPGAVITCQLGEGPDTVIEGFTITGGTGDTSLVAALGGGIYLSSTSPTIIDCVFTGNTAWLGGGLYGFFGASPVVLDCVFEGNTATLSGGPPWVFGCVQTLPKDRDPPPPPLASTRKLTVFPSTAFLR